MSARYCDYLILGAGCAGVTAAEEIRKIDAGGSIVMLTAADFACKRPLLSKSPLGRIREENYGMHSAEWFTANGIELVSGRRVVSLDTENRVVSTLENTYSYGKCVYALGGTNFIPPFKGAEKDGVMTVRTLEDLRSLKHSVLSGNKAVVIGGGVIGIEVAFELEKYGAEVTVLEAMPRLMPRQLDPDTSALLLEKMSGFQVCTGIAVKEICGAERAEGVLLEDGRLFPCGAVFISCGQKANIDIAAAAGIKCGRSVIVDERMRTSAPDVYACGDCAEYKGVNSALWSQARAQGKVAGINAAGGDEVIGRYDASLLMSLGPVNIFACGDTGLDPEKEYKCVTENRVYPGFSINDRLRDAVERRFYSGGRLCGGTIIGSLRGMQAMKLEMEAENDDA